MEQYLKTADPPDPPPFAGLSQTTTSASSTALVEPLLTSEQYRTGLVLEDYLSSTPQEGKGIFKWESGLRYSGSYREDRREGFGKLSWPDGSYYEGFFHHDMREGHGVHKWGDSGQVRKITQRHQKHENCNFKFTNTMHSAP